MGTRQHKSRLGAMWLVALAVAGAMGSPAALVHSAAAGDLLRTFAPPAAAGPVFESPKAPGPAHDPQQ
jgi:hypothetical protein